MSDHSISGNRQDMYEVSPKSSLPNNTPLQTTSKQFVTCPQCKLEFLDFWPQVLNPDGNFADIQLASFETLLPRCNSWLRNHIGIDIIKCETIEQKIWSFNQLAANNLHQNLEIPVNIDLIFNVKGLRLWYRSEKNSNFKQTHPIQIGYRNAVPKCLNSSSKVPVYDDLGPMYSKLNDELIDHPLEGPVLTVETVSVQLDRNRWDGSPICVDDSLWPICYRHHTFFFTRIFYYFQCPAYEQIGAADFLPDMLQGTLQKTGLPQYTTLPFVIKKLNTWLHQVKDIRIINIQTLTAACPCKSEKIQTNRNFMMKSDTTHLIRFLRVTYTRPKFGLPPGGLHIPNCIKQKTFIPQIINTHFSDFNASIESDDLFITRIKAWLKLTSNNIISIELLRHPLPLLLNKKDEGESTILPAELVPIMNDNSMFNNNRHYFSPVKYLLIFRVYFEGEFSEPDTAIWKTAAEAIIKNCESNNINNQM